MAALLVAVVLFAVAGAMALFGQKKVDVILGVVRKTAGASIAETVEPILIWMVAPVGFGLYVANFSS